MNEVDLIYLINNLSDSNNGVLYSLKNEMQIKIFFHVYSAAYLQC